MRETRKKAQSIVIASQGQKTSILCDGKLYLGTGMTEINFHHEAGRDAEISITCDKLPIIPDENAGLKDNFKKWLEYLMQEEPAEKGEGDIPSQKEGVEAYYKME